MRIAINVRFLLTKKMEGFGWYTFEVCKRLVEKHPEHTFIFLFDRPYDKRFIFGENVEPIVLFPPARHPFLHWIWFNISVTKALKKYKADVFFSPDGYLSLFTTVPQLATIHDLNFEHHPKDLPFWDRWFYRRYFPKFAHKAKQLLTVSDFTKQDIVKTYGIQPEKITVAWNGASDKFVQKGEEWIQEFRTKNTVGKPYFIFVGALHPRKNLVRLIQAFDAFSKINETIDLVIVGTSMWKEFSLKGLNTEGIEERIHFTGHLQLEELTQWMAGAYALAFVPYFEGFGIPMAEAMKCGVPIIAAHTTSLPEVAGDAAIYVDPFDVSSITKGLVEIAENKELYADLKRISQDRSSLFSWDKSADEVWEELLKIGSN